MSDDEIIALVLAVSLTRYLVVAPPLPERP